MDAAQGTLNILRQQQRDRMMTGVWAGVLMAMFMLLMMYISWAMDNINAGVIAAEAFAAVVGVAVAVRFYRLWARLPRPTTG